jgi:hypothetical protein
MTRRIAAWLLEREREEAARRAAIESAIAKPPPPVFPEKTGPTGIGMAGVSVPADGSGLVQIQIAL